MTNRNKTRVHIPYSDVYKIAAELILLKLEELVPKYARGQLIDLGCGTKPYEYLFSSHVDSYFGVDFGQTAEAHYGASTKADLYADCTKTGLQAEGFDTLLSTQVMEHIYETKEYVTECHRLLRRGGIGIFTIPFVCECHAEPHDYYRFTKYSIQRLFEDSGFSIAELTPLGGAYATLIQTKIISIYCREPQNLPHRIFKKVRNTICIPILNFMALNLDKYFWNDKLCINYALVVKKL